jgi:hypothetical protein
MDIENRKKRKKKRFNEFDEAPKMARIENENENE